MYATRFDATSKLNSQMPTSQLETTQNDAHDWAIVPSAGVPTHNELTSRWDDVFERPKELKQQTSWTRMAQTEHEQCVHVVFQQPQNY